MKPKWKSLSLGCVPAALMAAGMGAPTHALALAALPAVTPVMTCADLVNVDWTTYAGAPIKLNSVAEVYADGTAAASPPDATKKVFCKVAGYAAPKVRFEVFLPKAGWSQRYQFTGSGGYAGSVMGSGAPLLASANLTNNNAAGFPMAASGELVIAFSDLGHGRSPLQFADGMWALGDPASVVDFAYTGVHKAVVATKALTRAFYGQLPKYSYYQGCSDGGREGLHELQRYPDDFDGAIVGAPVIDEIATNTQWHAWFWRVNVDAGGRNILTRNKLPVLAAAVRQACGVRLNDGTYDTPSDPRTCGFNARSIATTTCDPAGTDACLTPAQADVANLWWQGPIDMTGTRGGIVRLTAGGMPYGSELFWGVPATATTPVTTLGDYIFSNDFPNYMSAFDAPTGITGSNMAFDTQTYEQMHVLTGIYDPTNPDLRRFRAKGGKLLLWSGSTDSGASPYMVLNYFEALKQFMGQSSRDDFTKLYLVPGAPHCGGNKDFYSPLYNWVEQGATPDRVDASYNPTTVGTTTWAPRSRPVWPHPSITVYDPTADAYVQSTSTIASDAFNWIGLQHYAPSHTEWCARKATGPKQWAMQCGADPN